MHDIRPTPEQLLQQIKQQENALSRGKLKIFFGSSAGVGKTYDMLSSAHQAQAHGLNVLVGIVETHGRSETAALLEGLTLLPLQKIEYRGKILEEFDIDAALAIHPDILLVDELAHSNVSGSRHPKRWHDVEELLKAGITVYTTLNVQHLESLNDVVNQITGVVVQETLPDWFFDQANEVVLVDLPAEELLARLHEGKVYIPSQAKHAIKNFFRKGNLMALRELALRRTADLVDADMQDYRNQSRIAPIWNTADQLLVGISTRDHSERLIRHAARLASSLHSQWYVVHVVVA
ncbi:sensor histidine kinase KdpD [Psychrobacter urativorans]|uniref:sensor histidine kinase KdpD n=1 Tax=Psychrobacter urativorans TaxID=45610 RepID=UPI002233E7E0|nr:sensor histidine kinase KdpD [Psychrobacter urativorans]